MLVTIYSYLDVLPNYQSNLHSCKMFSTMLNATVFLRWNLPMRCQYSQTWPRPHTTALEDIVMEMYWYQQYLLFDHTTDLQRLENRALCFVFFVVCLKVKIIKQLNFFINGQTKDLNKMSCVPFCTIIYVFIISNFLYSCLICNKYQMNNKGSKQCVCVLWWGTGWLTWFGLPWKLCWFLEH